MHDASHYTLEYELSEGRIQKSLYSKQFLSRFMGQRLKIINYRNIVYLVKLEIKKQSDQSQFCIQREEDELENCL